MIIKGVMTIVTMTTEGVIITHEADTLIEEHRTTTIRLINHLTLNNMCKNCSIINNSEAGIETTIILEDRTEVDPIIIEETTDNKYFSCIL